MDQKRDLARPEISEQAHDVGVTIDRMIAPPVELDPALHTPTPEFFAAPIFADARARRNAECKGDAARGLAQITPAREPPDPHSRRIRLRDSNETVHPRHVD